MHVTCMILCYQLILHRGSSDSSKKYSHKLSSESFVLSQLELCNPTRFPSGPWALPSPCVTLPRSLDFTPGTSFLITTLHCLSWWEFRFFLMVLFPSSISSDFSTFNISSLTWGCLQTAPASTLWAGPRHVIKKTKTEWGTYSLLEETGSAYVEQQDFVEQHIIHVQRWRTVKTQLLEIIL